MKFEDFGDLDVVLSRLEHAQLICVWNHLADRDEQIRAVDSADAICDLRAGWSADAFDSVCASDAFYWPAGDRFASGSADQALAAVAEFGEYTLSAIRRALRECGYL